ncbi:MAG: sulfotransferase family 2 domain-containing protein [Paracoccaceae bacterium]
MKSSELSNTLPKTSELLVFIHVPKTAGSTVNNYLLRSEKAGLTHAENWIDIKDKVKTEVEKADWISGHVSFPVMRSRLSECSARNFRFYTVVRDPFKQLASSYNWLIEIFHRGEAFYNGHPELIRNISETIRSTDNNRIDNVMRQLQAFPGLFKNLQARHVLGSAPKDMSDTSLEERLSVYAKIAYEATIPDLVSDISGIPYSDEVRENVSPYHFDQNVFRDPKMLEFLNDFNTVDIQLYNYISRR